MAIDSNVKLNIHFADPDLDAEELDESVRRLLAQLRELDEVESVERVIDPNPPVGNKASGGFLPGMLKTEVKPANIRSLFYFLEKRPSYTPLEMEVEVGGRKVRLKGGSPEELAAALQIVQTLMAAPTPTSQVSTRTILLLAANSRDASRLRLDEEVRDITLGLEQYRDRFSLQSKWAVRPRDIQRAMLGYNPQIVHFCGHGKGVPSSSNATDRLQEPGRKFIPLDQDLVSADETGLVFEDEVGNMKLIDEEALASLFRLFADRLECVVLNACYSEAQANAIAQHIPYVIGMSRAIGDRAAIEFAVGFYDALGAGRSIEFAYELACSAIQMAGIPEHLTPVLKRKPILP